MRGKESSKLSLFLSFSIGRVEQKKSIFKETESQTKCTPFFLEKSKQIFFCLSGRRHRMLVRKVVVVVYPSSHERLGSASIYSTYPPPQLRFQLGLRWSKQLLGWMFGWMAGMDWKWQKGDFCLKVAARQGGGGLPRPLTLFTLSVCLSFYFLPQNNNVDNRAKQKSVFSFISRFLFHLHPF